MSNLSQGRFELKLKFGQLSSGKLIKADMFHEDRLCTGYTVDITLPTKITLVVHGKDMNTDTKIDDQGNIVQDLHVLITGVYLDGFNIGEEFLYKKIKFFTKDGMYGVTPDSDLVEDGLLITPYLGFNGRVEFDLDQPTVFDQVMFWKNVA